MDLRSFGLLRIKFENILLMGCIDLAIKTLTIGRPRLSVTKSHVFQFIGYHSPYTVQLGLRPHVSRCPWTLATVCLPTKTKKVVQLYAIEIITSEMFYLMLICYRYLYLLGLILFCVEFQVATMLKNCYLCCFSLAFDVLYILVSTSGDVYLYHQ